MIFSRSLCLFLSATVAFAVRLPRHGVAGGATSPGITERALSAPSIICGSTGTDKEKPAAYSGSNATSIQDCLGKCGGSSGCQSVAFDQSNSKCLLYKAPVSGNINYNKGRNYKFYDLSCPEAGSSGTTSVLTLTVTAAPVIVTSTVIVIIPSTSTTPSSTSLSTSTYVVFVTVTQGVPLSSTSTPVIETNTIYAPQPPTTTSVPDSPTFTPSASTLSTETTSSSPVIASPSAGGLLCNVGGWSASNTSFFDDSGNLGNQVACGLACRLVSCGCYGFSNTTCLAYPNNVSQSVILDPNSVFRFFDAGCTASHS